MSHIPIASQSSPNALIADFISEVTRGAKHLSYQDLTIVSSWSELANGQVDEILVILADVLPKWMESNHRLSLVPLDKIVRRRLQEQNN